VATTTALRVFLVGQVALDAGGRALDESSFAGRQNRLLFAFLVAEHGRPVPRDELADALWGAGPPATWEKALTVIASKVRGLLVEAGLDGAALSGAYGCYRLELPGDAWVDMLVAADAADGAEAALRSGNLERARACAALAESLLRLPFLAGEDGAWVTAKRLELADVRIRALGALADACLRTGDAAEAAGWAEQAVALEPFRETGYRRLMEAHVAAGDRAEALRVYDRCRRLLAEELGAYPSPETEAIYRRLLDETPGPASPRPRLAPARRRRRRLTLAVAGLVIGAIVAAAFAIGGGSPPRVVPNSLVRIDPRTLKVTRVVRVADEPDLAVASGGYVWVTTHVLRGAGSGALRNAGDRTLTRVDPRTGDAVVVGGGLAPCGLAADPSGGVWVADCFPAGHDNVVLVGARSLAFRETWPVPGGDGFYRGLAYGGGALWVSQIEGGDSLNPDVLTRVDARTGAQQRVRVARPGSGLAWSQQGDDLWINNFADGSLTRLHAPSGVMRVVERVAGSPAFPVIDGSDLWVGDWSAPQVVRVRALGSPNLRRISLAGAAALSGVWDIAVGASAVWATTPLAGAVWRIDPKTNRVTRIAVAYLPTGVAADGDAVWVTVRGS
jgi:DNA-binding SARP family transcriptional activator